MERDSRDSQRDCSRCRRALKSGGVWCNSCGWIHIKCSGLARGKDRPSGDFYCPDCSSTGLSQALDDLQLDDHTASTGLTQALNNLSIGQSLDATPLSTLSPQSTPAAELARSLASKINSVRCKVLKFVPKASRTQFALALTKLIAPILSDPSDTPAWEKLLLMPFFCLQAPPRAGKSRCKSLASTVNTQISKFIDSSSARPAPPNQRAKSSNKSRKPISRSDLISAKLDEGDIRGAVRLAASNDDLEPPNDSTKRILEAKHPAAARDRLAFPSPTDFTNAIQLSSEAVRDSILSFKPGSAGGPSGLRPQHLKDAISHGANEAGNQVLLSITSLCNVILRGEVPDAIRPILAGANLFALAKKDGGKRPIAVGEVFRRLPAKCSSRAIASRLAPELAPIQLGTGCPNGAEAAAHAARMFLSEAADDTAFIKLDFSNAFNTLRRDRAATTIVERCPELYSFFNVCYSESSLLFYGEQFINSEEGLQQGDPIASLAFCLTIHQALVEVKSKFKLGYLDDISMGDNWKRVLEDLLLFRRQTEHLGLKLNPAKCELTCFGPNTAEILHAFSAVCPGIQLVPPEECTLLGAALGKTALQQTLSDKLRALDTLCDRCGDLPAHQGFFLLRNCFSIPKLLYVLRTSPAFSETQLLSEFDEFLRLTAERLSNVALSEQAWSQFTLPIHLGGMGLQLPSELAPSAFAASYYSCQNLISAILGASPELLEVHAAESHWQHLAETSTVPQGNPRQKAWTSVISATRHRKSLIATSDRRRLLGCSAPGSGDWLKALPSSNLGLCLSDDHFRVSIALRLGAPVSYAHKCVCGADADINGGHALICKRIKSRFVRHQMGNDVIRDSLKAANIPSTLEPVGLLRNDGRRPDGVTITPWSRGRALAWDFTCVHRLAVSNLRAASLEGPTVADEAEERKRNHYSDLPATYQFQPVAIETLGGIGASSWQFLKDLAKKIESQCHHKNSFAFLRQRLSIAVQRGNAACVMESHSRTDN